VGAFINRNNFAVFRGGQTPRMELIPFGGNGRPLVTSGSCTLKYVCCGASPSPPPDPSPCGASHDLHAAPLPRPSLRFAPTPVPLVYLHLLPPVPRLEWRCAVSATATHCVSIPGRACPPSSPTCSTVVAYTAAASALFNGNPVSAAVHDGSFNATLLVAAGTSLYSVTAAGAVTRVGAATLGSTGVSLISLALLYPAGTSSPLCGITALAGVDSGSGVQVGEEPAVPDSGAVGVASSPSSSQSTATTAAIAVGCVVAAVGVAVAALIVVRRRTRSRAAAAAPAARGSTAPLSVNVVRRAASSGVAPVAPAVAFVAVAGVGASAGAAAAAVPGAVVTAAPAPVGSRRLRTSGSSSRAGKKSRRSKKSVA
jgi:hypothetical protein